MNRRRFLLMNQKTDIYNAGDECTALTGGWSNDYYAVYTRVNVTKAAAYMQVQLSALNTMASFGTYNSIDLTNFGKLYVDVEVIAAPTAGRVAIVDAKSSSTYLASNTDFQTLGRRTLSIDISNLTGSKYIRTAVSKDTSANGNVKFYRYWME